MSSARRRWIGMLACLVLLLFLIGLVWRASRPRPPYYACRPYPSPDGKQIVFGSPHTGNRDIYEIRADGSECRRLTDDPRPEGWPAYSPDGSHIVYMIEKSDRQGASLYEMNLSGDRTQLTSGSFYDASPSYAPDGSKIVFARAGRHRPYSMGGMTWDHWDLHVINRDGTGETRLTNAQFYSISAPYFSPDGKTIVFAAGNPNHQVYVVNLQGEYSAFASTGTNESDPSFSPDGNRIVFVSDQISRPSPFDYEVCVMDRDGANRTQLTSSRSYNRSPVFSADGRFVLFLSDPERDGTYSLWRIELNGANPTRVVKNMGALPAGASPGRSDR